MGRDGMAQQDDASASLGLARCPVCQERPRGALLKSALRVVGYSIGSVFAYAMLGYVFGGPVRIRAFRLPLQLIPMVIGCAALIAVAIELRRWRAAGTIRIVRIVETPPDQQLAPARVVAKPAKRAPPIAKARPVVPAPPSAPPPVIAATPIEDGPRFLTSDGDQRR